MKVPQILIFIFLLAFFVRVYQLGTFPVGFHADEVRVGWNAYSILKTLRDDRGNLFALYYNTFGDYRPTGIFYLTIPSIILFGLNEFAVRFPSALIGALTIFPLYFVAQSLTKKTSVAILSAFFLALSPWHISVSRATSEVVISQFFALSALTLLFYAIEKKLRHAFTFSIVLFAVSFLFYHSIRLLAPIFVLAIFLAYQKSLREKIRTRLLLTFLGVSTLTLVFISSDGGIKRFTQVAIGKSTSEVLGVQTDTHFFDLPIFEYTKSFVSEHSSYFSGAFLVADAAKPLRYKTPNMGVITFAELALAGIGFYFCLKSKSNFLVAALVFISVIPASLTSEDSPNLHRALFMVPFGCILAAVGAEFLLEKRKLLYSIVLVFFAAQWMFFWHSYTTRAAYAFSGVRNEAARELAIYLNEVQKNYEKIILTQNPDDLYPWYAFFNQKDPREFNQYAIKRADGPWQYGNLEFSWKDCPTDDPIEKNVLVVDGFKCPVESKIKDGMQAKVVKQIKNPDGSVAYTMWEKN